MIKRMALLVSGCALATAAFAAAAFEGMAHLQGAPQKYFLSAYDLWYTYWPASLVITQGTLERAVHPLAWAWGIGPVLSVPAWLLLGAPGLAMIWVGRARTVASDDDRVDTLEMYDALARQAEADGYGSGEDDMAPDHGAHTAFSTANESDVQELERLMLAADAARISAAGSDQPAIEPPPGLPATPQGAPVSPISRDGSRDTGLIRPLLPPRR
jgi:hypothetical protein